jgi:hypothetical protein
VDTYLAPNKTFPELRDMLNDGSIDLCAISAMPAARNSSRCKRRRLDLSAARSF